MHDYKIKMRINLQNMKKYKISSIYFDLKKTNSNNQMKVNLRYIFYKKE